MVAAVARLKSGVAFLVVCGSAVVAAYVLHRWGRLPWLSIDWSEGRTTEEALATVLRLTALAACYWILFTSSLYVLAAAFRIRWLSQAVARFTLPVLRVMTQRLATGGLLVAAVASPLQALATTTTAQVEPVDPSYLPFATAVAEPGNPTTQPQSAPVRKANPESLQIEVKSGDNFWNLAEARVAQVLGRRPSNREIASYWVEVVAANRVLIRSGDPDLIFPGERIVLPALNPERG